MSTVPTSGISVEVSLLAPLLLMLPPSDERAIRGRRRARRHGQRAPTTGRASTLPSLSCASEYEPGFLVAPSADPDRGRSAWGTNLLFSHPGAKVKMCSRPRGEKFR